MTPEQRAVLAHVVVDPDVWWANAQAALSSRAQAALIAKVARWQASYDAVKDHPNYRDRATRPGQETAFDYTPA